MKIQTFNQSGFTLLEILVAASIFAIMSVIALTGMKSILDAQEATDKVASLMRSLQSTLFYLEQDLQYVSNRSVRDEYGDEQPAIKAGNSGLRGLYITRAGIRNPQGLKRSNLVRVRYWLKDDTLIRTQFKSLDRGPDNQVIERNLIGNVNELEFRFMNNKNNWISFWPSPDKSKNVPVMPRAIEVTLTHAKLGKITRLIALPN